jgi:hypothetical protein
LDEAAASRPANVSTDTAIGGDCYQAMFEAEKDTDDLDANSPYLLIQRDFEMSYDRECYVRRTTKETADTFLYAESNSQKRA